MLKQLICAAFLGLTTLSASAADLTPTLGEDSVYTVTEVTEENENTILTYEINKETYELTPRYYEIHLKNELGNVEEENTYPLYFKWEETDGNRRLVAGSADDHDLTYYIKSDYGETTAADKTAVYYKWQDDGSGGRTLVSGSAADYDLIYWKDPTKNYDRISTDQGGADIDHGFAGLTSSSSGGAIYNENSTIGDITGDFIGNSATGANSRGGAIYNNDEIGNITGDFIGNSATYSYGNGGAIYNTGDIGDITGDFIGNSTTGSYGDGGAIYNTGDIGDISGDFIGNSATGPWGDGGAIYNTGDIGNITGDFIGNTAGEDGGAIRNSGDIMSIMGDFIGNTSDNSGGAISNTSGDITSITGDFIGNTSGNNGGAIYNYDVSTIGDITGDFIGNTAGGDGGAIYNRGGIESIKGNFIGNTSDYDGGAIYNYRNSTIGDITGDFIGNTASGSGGAIYNRGGIESITGDFIGNTSDNAGGAIYIDYTSTIGDITGDFIGNSSSLGGAIFNNSADIGAITGDFIGNSSGERGGAIYNSGVFSSGFTNVSFIKNYVKTERESGTAQGGAIYTTTDLSIKADNGSSVFSGNYVETSTSRDDNAIYVDGATLNFDLKNGGSIVMKDNIDGTNDYEVNITGDDKEMTTFYMHNDIRNSILTAGNTTLHMINDDIHVYDVNSFTLTNDINLVADVDLAGQRMDRITSDSYGSHSGDLHVVGMNLISDAPADRDTTEIYFAETGLMNNVVNGTGELPDQYQTAYTPIYKYNVDYEVREDDGGYFLFTRGGLNSGNQSDNFNPAVLNTPVANLAAGQATINETFKYVFEHADAFTQLPAAERMAQIKNNQYALSTDYNTNLDGLGGLNGGLAPEFHNDGAWVRPYVTFESMNLKNGPDVDAITYGTLIGFDSDFEDFKNGWTGVTTGYVGYNGSQLSYSGNDTSMNGGLLGLTQTFYKGDFWTAITASAGASVGETSTMYGSEDFTSLLAGIGSKTGYNFEFKEGKYILQPIMFLSYTFVNTFDYTNAAGVKIESDPLHTIQLNPSVRFIANLKNGWQPYASVGMVWNLLNQTDTTANGISLPDMHVKPYVEYGIGVQKRWADKFTAFFQTMIRNGGRNGVALTGGFRWNLGKDPDKTVNNVNKVKKVIKTLDTKVAGK